MSGKGHHDEFACRNIHGMATKTIRAGYYIKDMPPDPITDKGEAYIKSAVWHLGGVLI